VIAFSVLQSMLASDQDLLTATQSPLCLIENAPFVIDSSIIHNVQSASLTIWIHSVISRIAEHSESSLGKLQFDWTSDRTVEGAKHNRHVLHVNQCRIAKLNFQFARRFRHCRRLFAMKNRKPNASILRALGTPIIDFLPVSSRRHLCTVDPPTSAMHKRRRRAIGDVARAMRQIAVRPSQSHQESPHSPSS
jgi:hypothetical protein